jgi:hypothetical protein
MSRRGWSPFLLAAGILVACSAGAADRPAASDKRPMLRTEPGSGFTARVLFSTGDSTNGYPVPGIIDGMVPFASPEPGAFSLLVTHELPADAGPAYRLANGTSLTGARITRFELDRADGHIRSARLAYREIRDRAGRSVTAPAQVSERSDRGTAGLESFCSAAGWPAGAYGFVDAIFFAHEEVTQREGHPHGGTIYALDVNGETLWALPELGRGSWENSAALQTPDAGARDGHVALLLGDDLEFGGAPLYLWIGRKVPGGNFVERNGLARGQLHVWVPDGDERSPQQWSGSGTARDGRFVPVAARTRDGRRGKGTDDAGYFNDPELRRAAAALGAFQFSRPEDVHTDPRNGTRAVLASTGHGSRYPADNWGNVYLVDLKFLPGTRGALAATARLSLLYDSDEQGDAGLRSPDNVAWAQDGRIYVQEDKANKRGVFGTPSGREASIWALDPAGALQPERIAEIDRSAVPPGSTDRKAGEPGAWESSGVVDATAFLGASGSRVALLVNVQAHGVTDGPVGGRANLVEASQILLLTRRQSP